MVRGAASSARASVAGQSSPARDDGDRFLRAFRIDRVDEHWNGVDHGVNVRPREGVLLQGGVGTGRTVTDICNITSRIPSMLFGLPTTSFFGAATTPTTGVWQPAGFCHMEENWLTQVKLVGVYLNNTYNPSNTAVWQTPQSILMAREVFTFDTFRIRNGKLVEYWDGAVINPPAPAGGGRQRPSRRFSMPGPP